MLMLENAIFLSVKPKYAHEILSGRKTVELRRTRPRQIGNGGLVVLYASAPVKAVVGTANVERIVNAAPDALWPMVQNQAGISREEFDEYFSGVDEATGIFIRSPEFTARPYHLAEIRRDYPSFHPPQAFRYLQSMGEWAFQLLARLRDNSDSLSSADCFGMSDNHLPANRRSVSCGASCASRPIMALPAQQNLSPGMHHSCDIGRHLPINAKTRLSRVLDAGLTS